MVDGTVATAASVNDNFSYLENKFSTTGGHNHDSTNSKSLTTLGAITSPLTVQGITTLNGAINLNNTITATGNWTVNKVTTLGEVVLTGLTASKPVFTSSTGELVSTGTVAITQGGTGATALTSLITLTTDVNGILPIANGGTGASVFPRIRTVTTSDLGSSNTTLIDVTGLSISLTAGKTYFFEANLIMSCNAVGGAKFAISGTCTATRIRYEILMVDNTAKAFVIASYQTALGGTGGAATSGTDNLAIIRGTIVVNAAGTLKVQFAEQVTSGTTTVLSESTFITELLD